MASTAAVAVVALSLAAVLMHFISVAIPYWDKIGNLKFGLWQVCYEECERRKSGDESFLIFQCLEVIGLITALTTCVVSILSTCKNVPFPYEQILIPCLSMLSAATILIGIMIYCVEEFTLHVCFVFSLCSAAFFFFFAGYTLSSSNSSSSLELRS
ncbi:uncharacterized protein LOC106880283 [Octopus bimaculoides]|uniref:uncharacterized protein LOC106880283 n=1 Tax=Octopus bimaculoides TaxID=37653 RepID=UPI00071DBDFD|nr:uncharacterized protein LOC106880283 [Octopus bimaculoides]|eukprot:XP_014785641.1 PREDICTED: uncharacterized protein LOC106880283 [Octopus bimaculoides]